MTDNKKIFYVQNEQRMADVVEAMNTIVCALNDETPYFNDWVYIVPDEAEREDFEQIADDPELLGDTISCFQRIVKQYMK